MAKKTRARRKKSVKARFSKITYDWTDDSEEQSQPSESADLIGSNDDILTEILLRLPATSILRFKSVSKHWRSLLSDRLFTLRYDNLLRSPGFFADGDVYVTFDVENQSIALFRTSLDLCLKSRGIRIPRSYSGIRIVQSCNGLLLCCAKCSDTDVEKYFVCNPTTKQFAKIPLPIGYSTGINIKCMNLAFHPRDCVHYKIVCIHTLNIYYDSYQIQIYSAVTGKWKISIKSFYTSNSIYRSIFDFEGGVYWNGVVHWGIRDNNIHYFDVNLERLQTEKDMLPSENNIMYLGESRGHLHLIVTGNFKLQSPVLKVYEMLNDHSGWFVKYEVEFHELTSAFPEMIYNPYAYCYDVMDVIRGVKEEDTFMVMKIPGKVIRYNIHNKSFKKISNELVDYWNYDRYNYNRYTETLTSF